MEKIKMKFNKLKEDTDVCYERESEAKKSLIEAETRYEAAECEKASYKRRFKLLQDEVALKTEQFEEQQEKYDNLETKTSEDGAVVKALEDQEVEGDERIESLNEMVKRGQIQAEDFDLQYSEAKRKVKVLVKDNERADERYEKSLAKVEELATSFGKLETTAKSLEAKSYEQSERDTENEEKAAFLREQVKETLVRAENAERDTARLDRVNEGILVDIENWTNKKNDIMNEMQFVSTLADDI